MKRIIYFLSVITALSVVLSACQGATQPPTSQATEAPVTEPTAAPPPAATEPPVTEAPVLVPIDLAGPPMEVGSRYTYVDGTILVAVPGGPFIMGSKYFGDTEREVTVSDFWIYSTKITNGQYARCVESGQCTPPNLENNKSFNIPRDINLPVTGVNYAQGEAYCTYVHARLPSEAEWEKTARGPDGNLFPWGDSAAGCNLLNYNFCKGKATDVTDYPTGVSFYGALDMSGNAREWAADWFSAKYYDESPTEDPLGPELGEKRSVRGSSYQDSADPSLSAHRFSLKPKENLPDLGFRCVVEDPTYYAPYCQTLALYGADVNGGPTDDVIPLPDDCIQPTVTGFCGDNAAQINTSPNPLPPGAVVNVAGSCIDNAPHYTCTGTGEISITPQTCTVPVPPGGGGCAPGYDYDGPSNSCSGKGPGKECTPGFNYDPAAQCCTANNPAAKVYGLCPPGFYQQGNACIPAGSSPAPLIPASYPFDSRVCDPDTGDHPDDPDIPCVPVDCANRPTGQCVPVVCPP